MDSVPLTNEMMDQPPRNFLSKPPSAGLARLEHVVPFLLPQIEVEKNESKDNRSVR